MPRSPLAPVSACLIQHMSGVALALLLFCYVNSGDFSWVTLTGPITLEPDLENMEGPRYVASPALQALITRFLFLMACVFFCMLPNLAGGLWRHMRHVLGILSAVYIFFSYMTGTWAFFAVSGPGAVELRMASAICGGILLIACYDTARKNFSIPAHLSRPLFIASLTGLFIAVCLVHSVLLQGISWLRDEHLPFALLRMGVFLTALTGALAFSSWKRGSS